MLRITKDVGLNITKFYPIDWDKYTEVSEQDDELIDGVYDLDETLILVKGNMVYSFDKYKDSNFIRGKEQDVLEWIEDDFLPKLKLKDKHLYERLKKEMDRLTI